MTSLFLGELLSTMTSIIIGVIVWGVGLSRGGPTGYAVNLARDLGPRIAHAVLPIAGKRGSDWGYAWIPVGGPLIGAVIAALFVGVVGNLTKLRSHGPSVAQPHHGEAGLQLLGHRDVEPLAVRQALEEPLLVGPAQLP